MQTNHELIVGDCRAMPELGNRSVHLIVTSPPNWQLKDYGSEDQLGFNDSYQEYVNNLNLVWSEWHRVLADGCRLCINIGDQFARSVYYGRYKVTPIPLPRTAESRTRARRRSPPARIGPPPS